MYGGWRDSPDACLANATRRTIGRVRGAACGPAAHPHYDQVQTTANLNYIYGL